ncbi:MAG: indolepyruvate oxidoreductase subunit beta [Chloroflexota bacterium]
MDKIDFLFVGVGGQGILTASDIAAEVGIAAGYDAKKSEIHGFSQRGGVVESHVRWDEHVHAPMGMIGHIDFLVCFEYLEAARFVHSLGEDGIVVTNTQRMIPTSVSAGARTYPENEIIQHALYQNAHSVISLDALAIAEELGNTRMVNTIVLGALSSQLKVATDVWLDVIAKRVPPKYRDLNHKAFMRGQNSVALT